MHVFRVWLSIDRESLEKLVDEEPFGNKRSRAKLVREHAMVSVTEL